MKTEKTYFTDLTKFTSGYIDRDGYVYPCKYYEHCKLSRAIAKKLNIKSKIDLECFLDNEGFVRISNGTFMWDKRKTGKQSEAMAQLVFLSDYKTFYTPLGELSKSDFLEYLGH